MLRDEGGGLHTQPSVIHRSNPAEIIAMTQFHREENIVML
jgi:hypothetical protein